MSGIISKEDGAGFQPWKIGAFDTPAPRPSPDAPAEQLVTSGEVADPGISLPTADDIERIYEEARAEGFRAGQEEGRAAAEQAGQDVANAEAQRFLNLANNLQQALAEIDQHVAEQLLALATEIAGQVVGGAIAVKTEMLLPIIREAIAALPLHQTQLSLRLNPVDAAHVRKQLGEQLSQTGAHIIEDGQISPGGCLVRAGSSEVDATIETRWRRVLEAIGAEPLAWLNP